MSFLLLIKKELETLKHIKKLRAATLDEKKEMLATEHDASMLTKYYFFNDKELAEHEQNMQFQFNELISPIDIKEAYEC